MNYFQRYIFPILKKWIPDHATRLVLKRQSGQTFVEFVLLLASIVVVAFSFMRASNDGISDKWRDIAQIVLEDDSQRLSIRN